MNVSLKSFKIIKQLRLDRLSIDDAEVEVELDCFALHNLKVIQHVTQQLKSS